MYNYLSLIFILLNQIDVNGSNYRSSNSSSSCSNSIILKSKTKTITLSSSSNKKNDQTLLNQISTIMAIEIKQYQYTKTKELFPIEFQTYTNKNIKINLKMYHVYTLPFNNISNSSINRSSINIKI